MCFSDERYVSGALKDDRALGKCSFIVCLSPTVLESRNANVATEGVCDLIVKTESVT